MCADERARTRDDLRLNVEVRARRHQVRDVVDAAARRDRHVHPIVEPH